MEDDQEDAVADEEVVQEEDLILAHDRLGGERRVDEFESERHNIGQLSICGPCVRATSYFM
jgi:hypothetical protein